MFSLPGWLELLAGLGFVLAAIFVFFAVCRAVLRVFARLMLGGPGGGTTARSDGVRNGVRSGSRSGAPCPSVRCRHRNVPEARFCARCGQPLPPRPSAQGGRA